MTEGNRRAAIIGGGVIGAGWAARFLLNGWDVSVFDPDPDAARKVGEVLENARASFPALSDLPPQVEGKLGFAGSLEEAAHGADYVQESVSERLDLKHRIFRAVQAVVPEAPLGSSTSGFTPTALQEGALRADRIFVAHPFNPVYLLPLVEVVPSAATDRTMLDGVTDILRGLGMAPLTIRKEIDAHIADRLLEAVWREALWLIADDVATTEEIDEAIRLGFGLRWAQMGLFETYRTAGGEAGMRHFMAQFGPCLDWPWTKLTDVPPFTEALVDKIAEQSDAQSGHFSIRELERERDRNLVGLLRALRDRNWGAGKVLIDHDAGRRLADDRIGAPGAAPLVTRHMQVLPSWIDYNGHMTESRYLFAASETSDAFLRHIGADLDYVAGGHSYYTVETHIMHRGEAKVGEALTGSVQVLSADDKRLHLFIRIERDGEAVATLEQMLLHVDMTAGRAVAAPREILDRLEPIAEAHAGLERPDAAGRYVGERR